MYVRGKGTQRDTINCVCVGVWGEVWVFLQEGGGLVLASTCEILARISVLGGIKYQY